MCNFCNDMDHSPFKRIAEFGKSVCPNCNEDSPFKDNGDDPNFNPKKRKATFGQAVGENFNALTGGILGLGGGAATYSEYKRGLDVRRGVGKTIDKEQKYLDDEIRRAAKDGNIDRRLAFEEQKLRNLYGTKDKLLTDEGTDKIAEYGNRTKSQDALYEEILDKQTRGENVGANRRRKENFIKNRGKVAKKGKFIRNAARGFGFAGAIGGVASTAYDLYNIYTDPESKTRRWWRNE